MKRVNKLILKSKLIILAIETSCDDTAVAVLINEEVISHQIYSQIKEHNKYGGVIPELAARLHLNQIDKLIQKTIIDSNLNYNDLDCIAFTRTPGLINALHIGLIAAKSLAQLLDIPLIPIDHLDGHIYSSFINSDPKKIEYPFLALVASGGHTFILKVIKAFEYEKLASSVDDSIGESFDKAAKMFNLGYPGGPIIDKLMHKNFYKKDVQFKSPVTKNQSILSFSGFKSQVVNFKRIKIYQNEDILSSFGVQVIDYLFDRLMYFIDHTSIYNVSIIGGVAANTYFKGLTQDTTKIFYHLPDLKYTGDNAAMIGYVAYARIILDKLPIETDDFLIDSIPFSPLNAKIRKVK